MKINRCIFWGKKHLSFLKNLSQKEKKVWMYSSPVFITHIGLFAPIFGEAMLQYPYGQF